MDGQPGLRERKKQQTWGLIAQTAHRLFQEHGFDAVTVADVAREADVSRKTVFNYFPTKEDLFYSGLEFFEARLLEAIRERKPGESILAAFERFVTEPRGLLAADDAAALAALIAEETQARPDDIAPWVAANAMIGLHKALVDHVRRRVLAGERDRARIARGLRAQARQAVALLEHGLGHLGAAGLTAG